MTALLQWVSRLIRQYIHDIGGEDLEGLLGILGFVIIVAGIIYFVLQRKKIRWWQMRAVFPQRRDTVDSEWRWRSNLNY